MYQEDISKILGKGFGENIAHKFLRTYIPAVSMSFTIIILMAGIINILQNENRSSGIYFPFQMLAYLIITCIADEWIGKIDFKTYLSHFITETILIYPITLFFVFCFDWFAINYGNLLFYSAIYLIIMFGIHVYFYQITLSNVAEMNKLLSEKSGKNE